MKSRKIGGIAMILCLIMFGIIMVPVAADNACVPITITSANLNLLVNEPSAAYSSGYLTWTYGQNLVASYKRSSGTYTQFADTGGNLWGECVSAVKALSGSDVGTDDWIRGNQVINGGVPQGTVIATFLDPDNGFRGHAAIFKGYVYSGPYTISGIEVWDQNWPINGGPEGFFGTHTLTTSTVDVGNAYNYYIVTVST